MRSTATLTDCTVADNHAGGGRRRPVQPGHHHADQLHHQRQHRHEQGRRLVQLRSPLGLLRARARIYFRRPLQRDVQTRQHDRGRERGSDATDAWGPFQSQGHNLIGNIQFSSGTGALDVWQGSDLTNIDPLLAPLGNYGGPTETIPLMYGSPAINAGKSGAGIPTTDQRGLAWWDPGHARHRRLRAVRRRAVPELRGQHDERFPRPGARPGEPAPGRPDGQLRWRGQHHHLRPERLQHAEDDHPDQPAPAWSTSPTATPSSSTKWSR